MRPADVMAAVRRHPGLLALLGVYLLGAGIAVWLAPVLGVIMLAALVLAGFVLLVVLLWPSLLNTSLHGPGYQYRDESSSIARRKPRR